MKKPYGSAIRFFIIIIVPIASYGIGTRIPAGGWQRAACALHIFCAASHARNSSIYRSCGMMTSRRIPGCSRA